MLRERNLERLADLLKWRMQVVPAQEASADLGGQSAALDPSHRLPRSPSPGLLACAPRM